jgi:DNA-binding beta-propeller fold protein YncE
MNARRLRLTVVASLCGLVGALALASTSAQAFDTHVFSSSFGSAGSLAGQLSLNSSLPSGVAINSVTHDVYVADSDNSRVDEFTSSGVFVRAWGWGVADGLPALETCTLSCQAGLSGSGPGELDEPAFIAVDNSGGPSAGDVYVGDGDGPALVSKFDAAGSLISSWGSGGQLDGSSATDGPFERFDGIAVGSAGALMVINGSSRVFEFAQDGSFTTDFEVARGTSHGGLAVDSNGNFFKLDGSLSVEEINASGTDIGQVSSSEANTGIAVDTATGDLYATEAGDVSHYALPGTGTVSEAGGSTCTFRPGTEIGCAATSSFGSSSQSNYKGIGIDPSNGSVYVTDAAADRVDLFIAVVLPDVTTGAASIAKPTSPVLSGVVDPDDIQITSCQFEYGTTTSYGHTVACSQTPGEIGTGSEPVPVNAEISGLSPSTEYHYRLLASNAAGTNPGADRTFIAPGPPIVDLEYATDVASTSATIDAQINPFEASTEYRLEYGTSTSYGQTITGNAGEGSSDVLISHHLQGLLADTTYHYRVVASNVFGPAEGSDRSFTTQAVGGVFALPDGRAWELVSPANKEGALIEPLGQSEGGEVQAASGGGAISYLTSQSVGENPEGKTDLSQILSVRGEHGWRSEDVTIPYSLPKEEIAENLFDSTPEFRLFSSDLSQAIVQPHSALFSPSPEAKERTVYLRDNANRTYVPLVNETNVPQGTKYDGRTGGAMHFRAATPDLSHILIESPEALTPEAKEGCPQSNCSLLPTNLYEWSAGRLQLVNIGPAGETEPMNIYPSQEYLDAHLMSNDGRRIVWGTGTINANRFEKLYVRDMVEKKTMQIGGNQSSFQTMSSDGSRVFVLEGGDLYEFDVNSGVRTDLTANHGAGESNAGVQELVLGAGEDGSYVYFVATGVLASDASAGQDNLYMAHDTGSGWAITHIATLSSDDEKDWNDGIFDGSGRDQLQHVTSRVSPNGRFVTFMSSMPLTGYDNVDAISGQRDEEVYLYDGVMGRLACASCDPTGARPVGVLDDFSLQLPGSSLLVDPIGSWSSNFGGSNHWLAGSIPGWEGVTESMVYQQRYLSDGGRLFFDSPDALVPQDTNGLEDVYEYELAGVGGCTSTDVTFSEGSGGCVSLISSGTSSSESAFFDASDNGDDAFFITAARLTATDYDTSYDVYDAHVCSTEAPCMAQPVSAPPCTSGDSCKAAPSPQPEIFGSAPSATFSGTGNVVASPQLGKAVVRKGLTTAQKRARALAACHAKKAKGKRRICERQARKRYPAKQSRNGVAMRKGHR